MESNALKVEEVARCRASYEKAIRQFEYFIKNYDPKDEFSIPKTVGEITPDFAESALNICELNESLLGAIAASIHEFNTACQLNCSQFAHVFERALTAPNPLNLPDIYSSLLILYRFHREYELTTGMKSDRQDLDIIEDKLNEWASTVEVLSTFKSKLRYVENMMPAAAVLHRVRKVDLEGLSGIDIHVLSKVDLKAVQDFDYANASRQLVRGGLLLGEFDGAERAIKKRMKVLEAHKERIESYTTSYNFVGLSKAFSDMCKDKIKELRRANIALVILCLPLVLIPTYLIWSVSYGANLIEELEVVDQNSAVSLVHSQSSGVTSSLSSVASPSVASTQVSAEPLTVVSAEPLTVVSAPIAETQQIEPWFDARYVKTAIPLISIELILLYFFRIKLQEARAVSAQILQINYRKSLCQFIQEYSTYSKEMNSESPGLLEKFESVVFSPIVVNENDIPSSFDGVSQIADLLRSLQKK